MKRAVIGLTADWESPGGYSKYPWYALRENYCSAIDACGGSPLILPHQPGSIETYLDLIDGLIITGGNFDINPALYGETIHHERVTVKEQRSAYEHALLQQALARKMPILGICGGHQLLNVILGGSLIQHIPAMVEGALAHEQPNPRHETSHTVSLQDGTKLKALLGQSTVPVNSAHHQAIKKPAPSLKVNALADDGIIEGIEDPRHPFCMGVQWHPEFLITPYDKKLLEAFIVAAHS